MGVGDGDHKPHGRGVERSQGSVQSGGGYNPANRGDVFIDETAEDRKLTETALAGAARISDFFMATAMCIGLGPSVLFSRPLRKRVLTSSPTSTQT
jgi:hypothetical protein